jgi:hypothetical protein
MSAGLSPKLAGLVTRLGPRQVLEITAVVGRDAAAHARLLEALRAIAADHEVEEALRGSGLLCLRARVEDVPRIAGLAGVEWVDVQGRAPLESLLDEP